MQQQQASLFLQSLRGNQAVIALAYLLVRQAMTIEQLEALTGISNDTVRSAVKGLAAKGLLFEQRGAHGRATWFPVGGTFFAQLTQNPKTSDSGADDDVVNVESEENKKLLSATTTARAQNPKTSDSGGGENFRACLVVLADCGIHGKKARTLAALDWVTPEYIRAHWDRVQGEMWDNPAGMMIYRIEGEMPIETGQAAQTKKIYKQISVDKGKRGVEVTSFAFDVDTYVSDFTGHKRGCTCLDCAVARHQGTGFLCQTCRKHYCECQESEEG
jgi:biotin operon repressor